MKIQSTSAKGNFELSVDSGRKYITEYDGWFSGKATSKIDDYTLEIKANNIWCSKFIISKNSQKIGDIVFNWKGEIILTFFEGEKDETKFIMKPKGFWKVRFEVFDQDNVLLCIMATSGTWKSLRYDYDFEWTSETQKADVFSIDLFMSLGYAANLYVEMISGGG